MEFRTLGKGVARVPVLGLGAWPIGGGTVDFCEKHGIGIIVHSPLAKGLLTGRYTPESAFTPDDERSGFPDFKGSLFARHLSKAARLGDIAKEKGISLVQLAVAWTLRLPVVSCALVGAKSIRQLVEHLGTVGVRFTSAEEDCIGKILASE